ncbi:glycosyltransferase [Rhodobacteraceae bacterium CCMM004]|nr:glycosyltransferase [Rhodobacteraceae bacterium CCMM004]
MAPPTVSVVVVSRGRPDALATCLTGLGQLWYPRFEVVVVADPAGLAAVAAHPLAGRVSGVPFDIANISAARNLGIDRAAGEVVAFLDDDAVPEPTWLDHLTGPFADPEVAATGGFVRGRNGISFQWRARTVGPDGWAGAVAVPGTDPFVPDLAPGQAVKTEGTNMAVRRAVLARLGGFDPRFRFYLDETDLNLRLAAAGHRTVLVPMAQVHHGFAPSERRRADRMPLTLQDIGASTAVFWSKHGPADAAAAERALIASERARLLRHLQRGTCEPRDVRRLLSTLEAGLRDGASRTEAGHAVAPAPPWRAPPAPPDPCSVLVAGRRRAAVLARARALRGEGAVVTALTLGPGARAHRAGMTAEGLWVQSGGLWGRSDRGDPRIARWTIAMRAEAEAARLTGLRSRGPAPPVIDLV